MIGKYISAQKAKSAGLFLRRSYGEIEVQPYLRSYGEIEVQPYLRSDDIEQLPGHENAFVHDFTGELRQHGRFR